MIIFLTYFTNYQKLLSETFNILTVILILKFNSGDTQTPRIHLS